MATTPAPAIDAPLSSLATGAAHDLRNLLFVIRAHCERLLDTVALQDSRRADVDAIRDAADRGATLASQLVTSGRTQVAARPVDVRETIRGIEPLVRRLVGERVSVVMRLSPLSWPVTTNGVQLEQIVMNLAINARDAMPDGGRLTIATENRTLGGTTAGQASQFVVISVSDTGHGIDPAIQDRIFEPYFTTKGSQGTGVGLATVRAIALLNGGHVEMTTSAGAGTTMRVVLPRASTAHGRPTTVSRQTAPARRRKRVLLVENERAIRDYLQRTLDAEGYDVHAAANGAEALGFSEPLLPGFDLLVTDVHLPDLDGPTLAKRLQGAWPAIGVVFISGDTERLAQLGACTAVPVLAKPFTTAELVTAVKSALAADRAV